MSSFPAQEELANSLTQLTTSTKRINSFVSIFEKNQSYVSSIIDQFSRYVANCPDAQKIPILYAIDALLKNFAGKFNPYMDGISKILVDNFDKISTVQPGEDVKLNKLLDMWKNKSKYFSSDFLAQLDAKNRTKYPDPGIDLNNIDFNFLDYADGQVPGKVDDNAFAHFSTGKEYDRAAVPSADATSTIPPVHTNPLPHNPYPYPAPVSTQPPAHSPYPPYNAPDAYRPPQPPYDMPPKEHERDGYAGAAPYVSGDRDRDYHAPPPTANAYDPRTQAVPPREQYDPRNIPAQQNLVSQPTYLSVTAASEAYPQPVYYKATKPSTQPPANFGERQHPLGFSIDANQQGVPPGKTRVASTVLWMGFNNNELSFQQLKEIFSRCGTPFIQIRILPKHAFVTLASRRQAVRAAVLLSGIPISVALGHSTTIGTGQSSNQPRQYGDRIKINWSKAQFFNPSTWDADLGLDLIDTSVIEEEAHRQIMVENIADLALIDLSQCLDLRKVTLAQDLAQLLTGPPIDPALSALVGNYARNEAFKSNFELKQQQTKADIYTRKYLNATSSNLPPSTSNPYPQPAQDPSPYPAHHQPHYPPYAPHVPAHAQYPPPQDGPQYPTHHQQPHYSQYPPQQSQPPQQAYPPQRQYPSPQQQPPYTPAPADYKAV